MMPRDIFAPTVSSNNDGYASSRVKIRRGVAPAEVGEYTTHVFIKHLTYLNGPYMTFF